MEQNHKPQIVFIHGGNSFDNITDFYDDLRQRDFDPYQAERIKWRNTIANALQATHESHALQMPNALNADYTAWSIWFEKIVPFLRDEVILVGHSLGGGFLLRYLTENKLPVTVEQLHLVAPCIDNLDCPGVGDFKISITSWSDFLSAINAVHLWHSKDDDLVPIHHSERFVQKYPPTQTHYFTDRGHFLQPEFPELLDVIQH